MNRARAKAAGLGLALFGSWASAADFKPAGGVPPTYPRPAWQPPPPAVLPAAGRVTYTPPPDRPPEFLPRSFLNAVNDPLPPPALSDMVPVAKAPAKAATPSPVPVPVPVPVPTPVVAKAPPVATPPVTPVVGMPLPAAWNPAAPPALDTVWTVVETPVFGEPEKGPTPAPAEVKTEATPGTPASPAAGPRVPTTIADGPFIIEVPAAPNVVAQLPEKMPAPPAATPVPTAPPLPSLVPTPAPVPTPVPETTVVPKGMTPAPTPGVPTPMPPAVPTPMPPAGKDVPLAPPEAPAVPKKVPPEGAKLPPPKVDPATNPTPAPAALASPKPAPEPEIPPAPPSVLAGPPGGDTPYHHGTFGSKPIRLSRDYPPLVDLMGWGNGRRQTEDGTAFDRVFFQAEYLLWDVTAGRIPALATTATDGGFGFIGDPATRPLLGPGGYGPGIQSGFRFRAGMWLGDEGTCGLDGSVFVLGRRSRSTAFDSAQFPTITRPIFAPNPGINGEFGEVVAAPNFSTGRLTIDNGSKLWGADANYRQMICRTCDKQTWWFAGFRFLSLSESLSMTENIVAIANPPDVVGTRADVQDSFVTRNRFYGGQLGGVYTQRWGRFDLTARGSVALGATHQELTIDGFQSRLRPGMTTPDIFRGGLLATPTNIGSYTRDRFGVVPELTLNGGYWVTPALKLYAGYNVLFWSNVLRPGDQIDRVVDVTTVPNPPMNVASSGMARPRPTFVESALWAHGIQLGAEWRW